MTDPTRQIAPAPPSQPRVPTRATHLQSAGRWLHEAARSTLCAAPRWHGLPTGAIWLAAIILFHLAAEIGLDWLATEAPASFDVKALAIGWLPILLLILACYVARPQAGQAASDHAGAPGTAALIGMLVLQVALFRIVVGLLDLFVLQDLVDPGQRPRLAQWAWWGLATGITMAAQITLLWYGSGRRRNRTVAASAVIVLATVLQYWPAGPTRFWISDDPVTQDAAPSFLLSPEIFEQQAPVLSRQLGAITPQRPGRVELFGITFAPYAEEDVFQRESAMVADVIGRRFDAAGHVMQLVNHRKTVGEFAWATPRNLERAIIHMASIMDRDEDILFLHLTSHGASNGMLAASFDPLSIAPVLPADLKGWLDRAGIRNRVISISACYAGKWIDDLANDDTLVMTASDATHTSYGCGRGSDLTFFGRAMYDEAIRNDTLSFEAAHAAARGVILQREVQAGKTDGYSNPQIRVGAAIKTRLARLQAAIP